MSYKFTVLATGRRKSAVAQVKIITGSGQLKINNQVVLKEEAAKSQFQQPIKHIYQPFQVLEVKHQIEKEQLDISIIVRGGGVIGQAQAIRLAVAKCICKINNLSRKIHDDEFDKQNQVSNSLGIAKKIRLDPIRAALKKEGFLTTDARCKERKKYGLKKARKASQFSKR